MADNRNTDKLFDKTVNIEPSGVMYNIKGSSVEEFVEEYLSKKGIDGIEAAVLKVKSEGTTRPEVVLYLFISTNSKFIKSSASNIPSNIRHKVDRINIELTDEFKQALHPLCGNELNFGRRSDKICYIKLNEFRVAGLMFAVDPRLHRIIISDVRKIPQQDDCIISVIKQMKYNGNNNNNTNTNNYSKLIDDIEDDSRD